MAQQRSFVRISSLLWADILVVYVLFVMQNYLTDVWGLSFIHSAAIMNFFGGICLILPVFCQFLVDVILGNFGMLVVSSIAYSLGIGFISLSTPPILANKTGTCKQFEPQCIGYTQRVLFYTGMALIAVGVSGNRVSVKSFLKEQNDEPDGNSTIHCCWQILGMFMVVLVGFIGAIALPYIKPWPIRFGIPAICALVAMILFLSGSCGPWSYKKDLPSGSPITNIFRVFVVFASNICEPFPHDDNHYRREHGQEQQLFTRTRFLRCLEKAAIDVNPKNEDTSILRPCSVAQVEEAKIAVRMIPIWMTFIICGIVSSIGNTYFVEQANHMNRNIGKWRNVPPQMLLFLFQRAKDVFNYLAKCLLTKPIKPAPPKGTPSAECVEFRKGKQPVFGIGMAMIFSILCCITAASIEKRRLHVIRIHDLLDKPDDDIPMSIYWLLFQFFLLAGLDSFLEKSVVAFFAHQAPKSVWEYLEHFTNGVSGLGFMFSVLLVYVVGQISEKGGKMNWFQATLNRSRLDKYYWVLAVLSSVNLVIFGLVAWFYTYKNPEAISYAEGENAGGNDEPGNNNDGGGANEPQDNNGGGDGCFCCC